MRHGAVGVHRQLAPGQAGVRRRPTQYESSRWIDEQPRARAQVLLGNDLADDFFFHRFADGFHGHICIVLHRDHNRAHSHRHIVLIQHCHLRLAVRLQPREAAFVQLTAELLCQQHRQRHPLRRFIGGIAHHDPLIARAQLVAFAYGLRDIRRLTVQAHFERQTAICGQLVHGVAHLRAQLFQHALHVHAGLGGDLARHQNPAARRHDLNGRARVGIASEMLVQQPVRELVAELVRVSCPHGLGSHKPAISVRVLLAHISFPRSS